ncbi:MAG: hypothetical protein HC921_06650 [Synechococcaceae cyanobacterium SM2_3_1]|nr:hypothetical protein [Synechococcaceae cyanobacterium SM2_3_1]
MLIDGFTTLAQILNFLVLVFLLQRFLYRPISEAVQQRQQTINQRLQEAAQKSEQAETEAEHYRQQQRELEAEREQLLAMIRLEVETQRQHGLQQVEKEAEAERQRWHQYLIQEQQQFRQRLRREMSSQSLQMLAHMLQDLANRSLEEQMIQRFLSHLQSMDGAERQQWVEEMQQSHDPVVIRTAFDLGEIAQQDLITALQTWAGVDLPLVFETQPELICGVELRTVSHRLSWTTADYLGDLDHRLNATLLSPLPT